jgi:hypothetical protein
MMVGYTGVGTTDSIVVEDMVVVSNMVEDVATGQRADWKPRYSASSAGVQVFLTRVSTSRTSSSWQMQA